MRGRKFHTIFGLDWKRTTRRRQGHSMWESVWDKTEAEQQRGKKKKRTRICHTHGGNIYLLKAGPDLLSFCSSAMFAPLFSTRKEKVQVRDETERKDDFQSWVCATKDAYGSIPGEQKCSTFCCQTLKGGKKIKASLCISQQTGGF